VRGRWIAGSWRGRGCWAASGCWSVRPLRWPGEINWLGIRSVRGSLGIWPRWKPLAPFERRERTRKVWLNEKRAGGGRQKLGVLPKVGLLGIFFFFSGGPRAICSFSALFPHQKMTKLESQNCTGNRKPLEAFSIGRSLKQGSIPGGTDTVVHSDACSRCFSG